MDFTYEGNKELLDQELGYNIDGKMIPKDVVEEAIKIVRTYVASYDQIKTSERCIKEEYEKKSDLVRPSADWRAYNGDDGRAPTRYEIVYSCPNCCKTIAEGAVGCADCRIFFDWSKKAKIKQTISVVWE